MKKLLITGLLAVLSTSALADEAPLTLDTQVVGSVTVGEAVLAGGALIAVAAAASSGGGSSNAGTNSASGTTGTTGTVK